MKRNYYIKIFTAITILVSILSPNKLIAAEEVAFVHGIFRRNISVKDIELLTTNDPPKRLTKKFAKLSKENPEKIIQILTEKIELPINLTSKLMYTKIGTVIIKRIAKIIYPLKIQEDSVTIPAIRAAVIKALIEGNGKINLISFLKSYPNKTIAVNIPALFKVLQKVESISDLVQFFSDSPLEKLKKSSIKT